MFEEASRLKLRFNFKGLCSVEDLWDLSNTDLNEIYVDLNRDLKDHKEESLLEKKTEEEKELELKVNILKYIFQIKQKEQEERENEIIRAQKKQKLLGFLADKQDEHYKNMSEEELSKIIDEL